MAVARCDVKWLLSGVVRSLLFCGSLCIVCYVLFAVSWFYLLRGVCCLLLVVWMLLCVICCVVCCFGVR